MHKLKLIIISLLIIGGGAIGLATWKNINNTTLKQSTTNQTIKVAVSILPQKQIVKAIGGERVEVEALIPAGFSPATYEPTVEEVKYLSQADIYFRIGKIGFERTNLDEIESLNPHLKIIDTSANNQFRTLEAHHHEGEEEEHETTEVHETELDPHVWLAPHMVKQQAAIIADSLSELDPTHQAEFTQNFNELSLKLDQLDKELALAFAPIKNQTILVYHPAFGYLADHYGFTQEHIEIEGQEPAIKDLQAIIEEAKMDQVKVVFVQKQFSQASAKAIAENIGGRVIQVDPLAEDYLTNITDLATALTSR